MSPLRLMLLAVAAAVSAMAETPQVAADRAILLEGVSEITAPGAPGSVCAFGPDSFAVVAGKEGRSTLSSVVAAGRWGRGRIVAFGHDGYLTATSDPGTSRLLANAIAWTSDAKAKPNILVRAPAALLDHLRKSGFSADAPSSSSWAAGLRRAQVLCLDARSLRTNAEAESVRDWVRNGGGLIIAGTGWGWASLNPGKQLQTDFSGNQLLAPTGIVFGAGTPGRTAEKGYRADSATLPLLNASDALQALIAGQEGKGALQADHLIQASASVAEALRSVPPGDTILLPRIAKIGGATQAQVLPAPGKPLKASDAIPRLLLTQELQRLKSTPPTALTPHPAAIAFPGTVAANSPRVQPQSLSIDTSVRDWHSTGLYAAPGAQIKVQIPAAAADKGLSVRIGCHSDRLWHLDKWERAPEITTTQKLTQVETTAANAFGGLIYVVVPRDCKLGTLNVTIAGGVSAPRFTLGRTTLDQWRKVLRQAPGPWAELETRKVILTVPSSAIRALEDPETLLRFWDSALDAIADLAAISRDRERPERIVTDVQISAGYMHSGYPIMTHLDVAERAVTLEQLKAGGWGFWHELGHNHQAPEWTFSGTGEVTCNLFSLLISEKLCGMAPGRGHDAMAPEKVAERLQKHLATRAVFERWKNDPFLALTMYNQLRAAFGWDTYRKVFAEYQSLPKSERPKNDDEKRDQWMVRFSRTTGRNLGPFFAAWGVPTTDSARAAISNLPEWMPADWPKLQSAD